MVTTFDGKSHVEGVLDVPGEFFTENGVSFKMVAVKGGTFEMGSESGDDDEKVRSEIVSDFMIGETEVTQALWEAVMENNPSEYKGAEKPVQNISWHDCQTFIKRLNKLTGKTFRLPTEAEWEYAARGGHKSKGIYLYSGSQKAKDVAWYDCERPHAVKKKQPNELGLYDMSGNVEEWCEDLCEYKDSWKEGKGRVVRGGYYSSSEYWCRVFDRDIGNPENGHRSRGFRLVLSVESNPDENAEETVSPPTVTDIDGNCYKTVQIGDQIWMAENLRTTRYADGTSIPQGSDEFTTSTDAYWYYPDNDEANKVTYGLLYNWKAVMGNSSSSEANPSGVQGICPTGWHVPSDAEWIELMNYVASVTDNVCEEKSDDSNGPTIAKALAAETGWNSSTFKCAVGNNQSSNNATGFSVLPAGSYYTRDMFHGIGDWAHFWSASQNGSLYAYNYYLYSSNSFVGVNSTQSGSLKTNGYSVRCVRDN